MARNGQIPARRPKNGPPSGQTATYRKTKVIQSCLRIWGTYDPIESGPYDPKKWGFRAKKLHFRPEILHFLRYTYETPNFFGSDGPDSMGVYLPHILR